MGIIIPVLICFGIAAVCAVLLTITDHFFAVREDVKMVSIRESLPGANCGACGFSGCDGYAKALSDGQCDKTNLCIPGGDKTAHEIAQILGVETDDVIERVAYVACNGVCESAQRKYDYAGKKSCSSINMNYAGDKYCRFACLGYGDCVEVCPQDAISIIDNVARVDPKKCIGCGICTRTCPNGIIHLINDTSRVIVECSNHDKGAQTRKYCSHGCIGCKKCEKTCPHDAIHVIDNLAVIDYEKCTGCGSCVEACPVHCLHEGNFICGAHS